MQPLHILRRALWLILVPGLVLAADAKPKEGTDAKPKEGKIETLPEPEIKSGPKPVPLASTRVLMDAINQPNFLALDLLLRQRPVKDEDWYPVGTEALLIAENGNLLLMRPPKKKQDQWANLAVALRTKAGDLAEAAKKQDFGRCRTQLRDLAKTCNRCHETFDVSIRLDPFTRRPIDDQTPGAVPRPPQPPDVIEPPEPPQPPQPPLPPEPKPVSPPGG